MSFLIRRNLPRAWAGWYDSFQRPPEDPIQWPWVHIGDGDKIFINDLEELVIPSNFVTANAGGASYEFEAFTPNWGIEFEFFWPVSGAIMQAIQIYLCESWAKVGALYQNMPVVRLFHEVAQHSIRVSEYPDALTPGSDLGTWNVPSMASSKQILRIWFDNDEFIRIWLNGNFVGSATLDPAYRAGPSRRCIRISNTTFTGYHIRWYNAYDRPSSIPPKEVWSSAFYDDFESGLATGWSQIGTNAAVASGSWGRNGSGTNGSVGLIRDSGVSSGLVRVEATTSDTMSVSADSGLVLCSNSAGNQGLSANIYAGKIYISRFSTVLSGNPPTFTDFSALTSGLAVAAGDKITFSVYNGLAWIEINGAPRLYAANVHAVVPATNTYAGLRVSRGSLSNSNSWADVRIFSGIS